jgi:hypothetical protein
MKTPQKLQTSHFAFIAPTGRNSITVAALEKQIRALEQLQCFMDQTDGFSDRMKRTLFGSPDTNSMGGTLEFLKLIVKNAQESEENCKLDASYIDMGKFEQSIIKSIQSKEQNAEPPSGGWNGWEQHPM